MWVIAALFLLESHRHVNHLNVKNKSGRSIYKRYYTVNYRISNALANNPIKKLDAVTVKHLLKRTIFLRLTVLLETAIALNFWLLLVPSIKAKVAASHALWRYK